MHIKRTLLVISFLLIAGASQADDRIAIANAFADLSLTSEDGTRQAKGSECNYYGSGIGTTMVCTYKDEKGSCTTVGTASGSHSIGDHPGCPTN